jgi:prepilin-type N-terminal cleavage/methylation domain-containing protein
VSGAALPTHPRSARRAGFTLVEVLAAVFLTSIVIGVALAFFVGLSDATQAAAAKTQKGRRAFAVLDRLARDLEGAYLLVTPPEVDPLSNPWLFLAESAFSADGSDRLKFTSRNFRPRNPVGHGSDLAIITYLLHTDESGESYELLRSISPGLPESLEREFPSADDESMMLVAEGISTFSLGFLGEDGEWQDAWDSSLLVDSGTLPLVVEIEIGFVSGGPEYEAGRRLDEFEFADADSEEETFTRVVRLPMRPVDLASMLQAGATAAAAEDAQDDDDDDVVDGDDDDLQGDDTRADGGAAEGEADGLGEELEGSLQQ